MLLNKELLFSGIKWQSVLTLLKQVLSLLAILVVIRIFDRDQYGNYQFVFVIFSFFGLTALSGMQNIVNQSVARGYEGSYIQATSISFRGACFGGLLIFLYSGYQYIYGNRELAYIFITASFLFPFAYGLTTWQPFLLAKQKYQDFALIQSFSIVTIQLFLVGCVLLKPDTIFFASLIALLVTAIQNIYMYFKCCRSLDNKKVAEDGSISYAFKVSFYDLFNVLGNLCERFIIFTSMSPSSLAGFAVADRIPELVKGYIKSLRAVIIPQLARQKKLSKSLNNYLNKLAAICFIIISITSFFVIPWIFTFLFTEDYSDVVIYCQILLLTVGLSTYSTLKFGFILSRLDDESVKNIHIISNTARVLSAIIFIPLYGIPGAVTSIIIYRFITVLIVNYQISKLYLDHKF